MRLAETGTRGLLGAMIGAADDRDEATLARRLLPLLGPSMLLLLTELLTRRVPGRRRPDRGRAARPGSSSRSPAGACGPGRRSYLSRSVGLAVRIIDADVAMTGAGRQPAPGTATG